MIKTDLDGSVFFVTVFLKLKKVSFLGEIVYTRTVEREGKQ